MGLNKGRIWLGALAGSVVWFVWSFIVGQMIITNARYQSAIDKDLFLKEPRYPFFVAQWFVMLLIVSVIVSHLYAWTRSTLGPGPRTALKVGLLVGFAAGFPLNFATASWSVLDRTFPLGWMLDMWVGCILATFVAAALYKSREEGQKSAAGVGR